MHQNNDHNGAEWNGRGEGHTIGGGGEINNDSEGGNVHPIVKKIERERRDARQAQEE